MDPGPGLRLMPSTPSIQRLRFLRFWFLAAFALVVPALGALTLLFGEECLPCLIPAVLPFFVLGTMLAIARCPRCAKTFWGLGGWLQFPWLWLAVTAVCRFSGESLIGMRPTVPARVELTDQPSQVKRSTAVAA